MQNLVSCLTPRVQRGEGDFPFFDDAIRIVVADAAIEFREATCDLLKAFFDVEISGCAKDGFEALQLAIAFEPDLLIMDAGLPGLSGFATASLVADACPTTQILMISSDSSPRLRESSIAAGAHGFSSKADLAILFAELCGPAS